MSEGISRRSLIAGTGALVIAATTTSFSPARAATSVTPLPLTPLRIPEVGLGVEQQSDAKVRWLHEAKLGMFLRWGPYAGPARGERYMHNAPVMPENYRKFVTEATSQQFTASAYNPADWAQLAKDMGAVHRADHAPPRRVRVVPERAPQLTGGTNQDWRVVGL